MRGFMLLFVALVVLPAANAQAPQVLIKAGRLVDGRSASVQPNVGILIEGERIKAVGPLAQIQGQAPNARVIDLSQMTVLPGLIDAHTHLLLQGDVTSQEYEDQLLKQSTPYRAILAARNARIALEHGFTAIRDLETEGAMYADVDVKLAVDRGDRPLIGTYLAVSRGVANQRVKASEEVATSFIFRNFRGPSPKCLINLDVSSHPVVKRRQSIRRPAHPLGNVPPNGQTDRRVSPFGHHLSQVGANLTAILIGHGINTAKFLHRPIRKDRYEIRKRTERDYINCSLKFERLRLQCA